MPRSLDILQNQPVRFGFNAETCANNDNRAYCMLVHDGDPVQFQGRRILGTDVSCDLLAVSSTQLVTNSGFTGSAASWSLVGGWSYGANAVSITAGTGTVSQTVAVTDGALYKIVIVLTSTLVGDMNVYLYGDGIAVIPDGTVAGTYTYYAVADTSGVGTGSGFGGNTITATVTSFEMYAVAECFTFDVTDGTVQYDPDFGLSIDGTVGVTYTPTFEPSLIYSPKTTINIAEYVEGTVEFAFDGSVSGAIEGSNGDLSYTLNGDTAGPIGMSFTDFTGLITSIEVEQLSTDYYFGLYTKDGTYVQSLNAYVTYCQDFVQLKFDPQAEGFNYGCYKIGLYDPYLHEDQIEYEYTNFSAWTTTGSTWDLTNPGADFDAGSNTNANIKRNETATTFALAWAKLRFETGTNSGTGIGSSSYGARIVDTGGPTTIYSFTATSTTTPTIYSSAAEGDISITYGPNLQNSLEITSAQTGDHYEFVKAFYKLYPFHLDYFSNCFTYSEEVPCSKMIYAKPGENLGFNTKTCDFAITQRFRILKITPTYKVTSSSDFISSDSTRTLISGTGMKLYTLLFDYMDEVAHDVVLTLILSKEVYIGDEYSQITAAGKRYFVLPQDYTPEWDKDGKLNLAMGRILIMEYDQVKFTTNCGN